MFDPPHGGLLIWAEQQKRLFYSRGSRGAMQPSEALNRRTRCSVVPVMDKLQCIHEYTLISTHIHRQPTNLGTVLGNMSPSQENMYSAT